MWVRTDLEGRSGVHARSNEDFGGWGMVSLAWGPFSHTLDQHSSELVLIHQHERSGSPQSVILVLSLGDLPWHSMGLGRCEWETPERGWEWPATMPAVGQLLESRLPRRLPQDAAMKGSLAALPSPPSWHSPKANMVSLWSKNLSLLFPSSL